MVASEIVTKSGEVGVGPSPASEGLPGPTVGMASLSSLATTEHHVSRQTVSNLSSGSSTAKKMESPKGHLVSQVHWCAPVGN